MKKIFPLIGLRPIKSTKDWKVKIFGNCKENLITRPLIGSGTLKISKTIKGNILTCIPM